MQMPAGPLCASGICVLPPGKNDLNRRQKYKHMMKPKRVNQTAIAKATGVSRATVSLVLRGGVGASAETSGKVFAMAEKMGYRPNALVHSIRSGKSRTVGVLIHPHDSYWTSVLEGIHDRLIESDHLPLILWNNEHIQNRGEEYAVRQIHRLLDRWVDGVILWPHFATLYAEHLREFEKRNIPLVTVDHTVPKLTADTVECNESQIGALAVSHLAGLQHKAFLIISGPENVGWADERCRLFKKEITRIRGSSVEILRVPYRTDYSKTIANILKKNREITAVLAGTDHLATQAYKAAAMLGLKIPSQLSVVGVGDLNFAEILSPTLTTVRQDGYSVGQKAAQVELERGWGLLSGAPRSFDVPVQFVERNSTAARPGL